MVLCFPVRGFAYFAQHFQHLFVAHVFEFSVFGVFVFVFWVETVKLCYDAALFSLSFPFLPAVARFPGEGVYGPQDGSCYFVQQVAYGLPEFPAPLPPQQVQGYEYTDYPAGHAVILYDKVPNFKDYFLRYGHGVTSS